MLAKHGPVRQRLLPWPDRRHSWARLVRGFTLLELLVVLAIMAMVLGAATLALRDPAQAALAQEGQRLAAWLETGRAQARASGQEFHWRPTATGFNIDGGSLPIASVPWLDARTSVVSISRAGDLLTPLPASAWVLVLGPEPILPPQSLVLRLGGHDLRITSDGLSPFTAQQVQ